MISRARTLVAGAALSLAMLALGHPSSALAASAGEAAHAPAVHHVAVHHVATHRATAHRHATHRLVRAQPSAPPIWTDSSGSWRQVGIASWYGGKRWQGRRTSSGARYDENLLTAAHATLPLGSRVRVVVPATGRSVVVTINDRPGTRTRIIDLSRAAAAKLGILRRGIATVALLPD